MTVDETPAELADRIWEMDGAVQLASHIALNKEWLWRQRHDIVAALRQVDALLAENVQLRQAADLFRANFSPWLIHNAPDLYRSLWGEW